MCSTSTPSPPRRKASRRFDDVVRVRMAESGLTLTSAGHARSVSCSRVWAILRRSAHEDVSDMDGMALSTCGICARTCCAYALDDLALRHATRARARVAHVV